jgi:hypothetical protein
MGTMPEKAWFFIAENGITETKGYILNRKGLFY